jgi:hypothetical protein
MDRYAEIAERVADNKVDEASPRAKITDEMMAFLDRNHLNSPYLNSDVSNDKKYRYVIFAKPRVLDGEVRVYNPKFIMVAWQTAFRDLPHKDKRVFGSLKDAMDFIRLAFVELKFDDAMDVPHRG